MHLFFLQGFHVTYKRNLCFDLKQILDLAPSSFETSLRSAAIFFLETKCILS